MEVDRAYADGRGWNNRKGGKGKGENSSSKGFQKGKGKGKSKMKDGKSGQKGKSKFDSKGKSSGKSDSQGKGKGGRPDVTCHKCGKYGHYARDLVSDRFKVKFNRMCKLAQQLPWLALHLLHLRNSL